MCTNPVYIVRSTISNSNPTTQKRDNKKTTTSVQTENSYVTYSTVQYNYQTKVS